MSDLPERIWVYKTDDGNLAATRWEVTGDTEYLRADLAPAPVGFSREQMVTAMEWADVTDHYIKEDCDEYLSDLTPASEVPIPTVDDIEDLIQSFGKPDDEGRGWAVFEKDFDKLAQAIHALLTKSRGGV